MGMALDQNLQLALPQGAAPGWKLSFSDFKHRWLMSDHVMGCKGSLLCDQVPVQPQYELTSLSDAADALMRR